MTAKNYRNSIISKGQTIFKGYIIEKRFETIIIDQNDLEQLYLRNRYGFGRIHIKKERFCPGFNNYPIRGNRYFKIVPSAENVVINLLRCPIRVPLMISHSYPIDNVPLVSHKRWCGMSHTYPIRQHPFHVP